MKPIGLPVEAVLPQLIEALEDGGNAVLQAPPGAGKTTLVPLALLDRPWLTGRKIVMLEPRRLAARAATRRMADLLGEEVGDTAGYRIRLDTKISRRTRIEVVTDGIFIRMVQDDPTLEGIGAVLFDEFHERSLDADFALALCLEAQAALRPDLRLLAMSATLDGQAVAKLLGDAPIITSDGRAYPVEIRYLDKPAAPSIEATATRAIERALAEETGSILVFLPGMKEIRRVEAGLMGLPKSVDIAVLHGDLTRDAQDRALARSAEGRRKVVLSSAIAETSLTIDGIRVVIDAGLARTNRFDPRTGMSSLVTQRVSRASADQRAGRAGRLEPGICYRLWTEAEQRTLIPDSAPEIMAADLSPLALELATWGVADAAALPWMTPPPEAALASARDLLRQLGALDEAGGLTRAGQAMTRLGVHPRLARMMIAAKDQGRGGLGCALAALVSERDILRRDRGQRDGDVKRRLESLLGERAGADIDHAALSLVRALAKQFARQLGIGGDSASADEMAPAASLLALAYPDRIAKRRAGGDGQYLLSSGRGASFRSPEPLAAEEFLVVIELDGGAADAWIQSAIAFTQADLETVFADEIETVEEIAWDSQTDSVVARRRRKLGALVLKDERLADPDSSACQRGVIEGIRRLGLDVLPWDKESRSLQARIALLRRIEGEVWPDCSDSALEATLEDWLAPHLGGITRRSHFSRINLAAALIDGLEWAQRQRLGQLAPTHLTVPSGSRIHLDYTGDEPVLAVRLQELFGLTETPRLVGGRVPVVLHLLSPANRPIQVTRDLAGFWAGSYIEVKKDLKGRYPKHPWPDDPLSAEPTARAKRRGT